MNFKILDEIGKYQPQIEFVDWALKLVYHFEICLLVIMTAGGNNRIKAKMQYIGICVCIHSFVLWYANWVKLYDTLNSIVIRLMSRKVFGNSDCAKSEIGERQVQSKDIDKEATSNWKKRFQDVP